VAARRVAGVWRRRRLGPAVSRKRRSMKKAIVRLGVGEVARGGTGGAE
jgi:hypothetical protein